MKNDHQQTFDYIVNSQKQAEQFYDKFSTEFSMDEDVQKALAKSQQYEAKNGQPTYEPNKPF